ncbi:MAG: SDR family oxidoreductase [Candidatus Omnitrophota bacterium]
MKLRDKVILVTGSSRGIGRAIAARLAKEGASIIINSSKSIGEAEKTLAVLPKRRGQRHCFIPADVTAPEQVKEMMKEIKSHYGRLDALINNAGTTTFIKHSDIEGLTTEIFDLMYKTHLRGCFLCVQQAFPLLKKSKDAQVINIASIAALTAVGSNIAYCAMKAGVVNMTMSLARALAPRIRVNAISPGLTETDLIKGWGSYKSEQIRKTPLRRLGKPEDIAEAAFALLTSLNYVTGQNIIVDGGRTLE